MMVLRSMLYVPGNSMRMITKTASLPADAVILDLEDAVPLLDKGTARIMVRDSVKAIKLGGFHVFVRVNALTTGLTAEDFKTVVVKGLDGIMLAKTEEKSAVAELDSLIGQAERISGLEPGSLAIIPLIESAKGIINTYEIASASGRVVAVAFGAGDYYRDLGRSVSSLSPEECELLYARSHLANAGRAAGVQAIDTPFLGLLTDRDAFIRQTRLASQLGFKGKQVIHPAQIDFANETFSPAQEDVNYASRLVEAFAEARDKGLGAISFEGRMIDYMSYQQASDLVYSAGIITEKEAKRQAVPSTSLFQFFTPST